MKNSILKICDVSIQPGETVNLGLPLPEYNSCTSFIMPIKVIHGKEEGPCVLLFSGLNGDELNGIEIINRLLQPESITLLNGTIIAIPIINVPALIHPNFMPYEKKLEDCFSGKVDGNYGERIAHVLTQEIMSKATYAIELETGSINNELLPQVHCDAEHDISKTLAKKFSTHVIGHIPKKNSLHEALGLLNVPFLIYKGGEAKRFDESAINIGLTGIKKVLASLGMIELGEEGSETTIRPIFSEEQEWLRAHGSGILSNNLALGSCVKKDDIIGYIKGFFKADIIEAIKAPKDGIIIGINRNPLVYEGQNIFKLAAFIDNSRAEITLEEYTLLQEAVAHEQ